ncbi:MAG: hypothetical protein IPH20_16830 [Bacteroidales bacterium]|nr:hypothetical protein [Bacteroidales bacterium]
MRKFAFSIVILFSVFLVKAQENAINPNGYNKFLHPNGKVSSEGMMREGKPDGYWKTFHENGVSEGRRKPEEF